MRVVTFSDGLYLWDEHMGIIDVNIEKPALKREEIAEKTVTESSEAADSERAEKETVETDTDAAIETDEPGSRNDSSTRQTRGRRLFKAVGTIGAAVVGIFTLKKLRSKRRSS